MLLTSVTFFYLNVSLYPSNKYLFKILGFISMLKPLLLGWGVRFCFAGPPTGNNFYFATFKTTSLTFVVVNFYI